MRIFRKQSLISMLPLGILLTLSQSSLARADVLTPGTNPVSYCFKITNIDEYRDYSIVVHVKSENSSLNETPKFYKSGECVNLSSYRNYAEVYAMKNSDINLTEDTEGSELKNFESKKSKLIPTIRKKIVPIRRMKDVYQIARVAKSFEIDEINDRYLRLRNGSITYFYKNDKSETKAYVEQDKLPLPSNKNIAFHWYLPILGMSLIGGAAYWNKSKKS
ncbi:MAG: hypothetical protein AAFQ91_15930 [Cyanobacteria bacterium J06621_15]